MITQIQKMVMCSEWISCLRADTPTGMFQPLARAAGATTSPAIPFATHTNDVRIGASSRLLLSSRADRSGESGCAGHGGPRSASRTINAALAAFETEYRQPGCGKTPRPGSSPTPLSTGCPSARDADRHRCHQGHEQPPQQQTHNDEGQRRALLEVLPPPILPLHTEKGGQHRTNHLPHARLLTLRPDLPTRKIICACDLHPRAERAHV